MEGLRGRSHAGAEQGGTPRGATYIEGPPMAGVVDAPDSSPAGCTASGDGGTGTGLEPRAQDGGGKCSLSSYF